MFRLPTKPSSGVSKHRILKVAVTDPVLKLIALSILTPDPLQLLLVFYVLIHLMMASLEAETCSEIYVANKARLNIVVEECSLYLLIK
jgi:hypothetical protein